MVAAALRAPDGRWLLHRRPAHKHHGGLWEFPGGKVEADETPGAALVRELREELGVTVDSAAIKPLAFAQDQRHEGPKGIVILLYTVDDWEGEPTALEAGAVIGWFARSEIAALDKPPLDVALCLQVFAGPESRDGAG